MVMPNQKKCLKKSIPNIKIHKDTGKNVLFHLLNYIKGFLMPKTSHVMCPFPAVKPCLSACNAPCHNARVLCIDIVRLGVLVAQTTVAGGAASVLDVGLFGKKKTCSENGWTRRLWPF